MQESLVNHVLGISCVPMTFCFSFGCDIVSRSGWDNLRVTDLLVDLLEDEFGFPHDPQGTHALYRTGLFLQQPQSASLDSIRVRQLLVEAITSLVKPQGNIQLEGKSMETAKGFIRRPGLFFDGPSLQCVAWMLRGARWVVAVNANRICMPSGRLKWLLTCEHEDFENLLNETEALFRDDQRAACYALADSLDTPESG